MIPYSVVFPIKDISAGEMLTCDLIPRNIERETDKYAYLLAFEQRLAPGQEIDESKRNEIIKAYEVSHIQIWSAIKWHLNDDYSF